MTASRLRRAAPWILAVSLFLLGAGGGAGIVTVNQGTSPWITSGTSTVSGVAASGAAVSGNPVRGAGSVVADGAFAGLTAANVQDFTLDTQGKIYVRDYGQNIFEGDTGGTTVTTTTQMLGLSGASLSYYITDVVIANGATAQTLQLVSSTTAGNACATSPANVGPPISLGGPAGMAAAWKTPRKVTANSALCCKPSGSTAFSCEVHGFIAP